MVRYISKPGSKTSAKELLFMKIVSLPEGMFHFESSAQSMGYKRIAGVDEVGRGALAGPVLAAAIILPCDFKKIPEGIKDSKELTQNSREKLFPAILESAISCGIGIVDSVQIDQTSILKASLKAMELAVLGLEPCPDIVFVDGNQKFSTKVTQRPIVRGDSRSVSIAAASIVAKVIRDNIMETYHSLHPDYGFNKNKGYGTRAHLKALKDLGHCMIHRTSYRGVL